MFYSRNKTRLIFHHFSSLLASIDERFMKQTFMNCCSNLFSIICRERVLIVLQEFIDEAISWREKQQKHSHQALLFGSVIGAEQLLCRISCSYWPQMWPRQVQVKLSFIMYDYIVSLWHGEDRNYLKITFSPWFSFSVTITNKLQVSMWSGGVGREINKKHSWFELTDVKQMNWNEFFRNGQQKKSQPLSSPNCRVKEVENGIEQTWNPCKLEAHPRRPRRPRRY